MNLRLAIVLTLMLLLFPITAFSGTVVPGYTSVSDIIEVDGFGDEGQGMGIAIADFNGNGIPDMLIMAYDNPPGANSFRYKIGYDLNEQGVAQSWSKMYQVSGVGHEGAGAAAAIVPGTLWPIFMAYDNPPGANNFRLRIGGPILPNGKAEFWHEDWAEVPGFGDWEGAGAGMALDNLDADIRPEMVLLAYDRNLDNQQPMKIKVGMNCSVDGTTPRWTPPYYFPAPALDYMVSVGRVGVHGAAVAFAYLDDNPRPDLLTLAYVNAPDQNVFRILINWNMYISSTDDSIHFEDPSISLPPGTTIAWCTEIPGVGWEGQGASLAVTNLDSDPRPDLIVAAYDNPPGHNTFRYRVVYNFHVPTYMTERNPKWVGGYVSNQEDRFTDYVWSFVDEIVKDSSWNLAQYYYGHCYELGDDHFNYADAVDFAYVAGHGNQATIDLSNGEKCSLSDMAWGEFALGAIDHLGELDFIVFHSCNVLSKEGDWREKWRNYPSTANVNRPFAGLHMAMGFHSTHYNGIGAGESAAEDFAVKLKSWCPIREAWMDAVEANRWLAGWEGNLGAVFYIRKCKDEHDWAHVFSSAKYGDPDYLLDAEYMVED